MGRAENRVVVVWEAALSPGYPLEVWECYNLPSSVPYAGCLFLTLLLLFLRARVQPTLDPYAEAFLFLTLLYASFFH